MNFSQVYSQLFWILPTTLVIVAIFQSLYWIWLMRAANHPKTKSGSRLMMPTNPRRRGNGDAIEESGDYTDSMGNPAGFQGVINVLDGMANLSNREIRMPKNSFTLGRFYNPDEDILVALDERSISRRHARFTTEGNSYYLTDIGSSYGTSVKVKGSYVNLSADQREQVYDGDEVIFGNTVRVRLQLPGTRRPS